MELSDLLAGSNDEELLDLLYSEIGRSTNPAQDLFVRVWEISGFIASSGFEWFFEQEPSLGEFARLFEEIGFPDAAAVIRRARDLVPSSLLDGPKSTELFDHVRGQSEPLKSLLYEYLDLADTRLMPALGDFVRARRDQFPQLGELSSTPRLFDSSIL